MDHAGKILVVDDDPNLRKTLTDILRVKGYDGHAAATGAEAIALAAREKFGVALIDLMLPDMPGLDVMERIKETSPLTEAIILTGHASMDTAIDATKRGAFSYLVKPYRMDELLLAIRHGIERAQAQGRILHLASFPRLHPSPVLELDGEGRVTYANPVAERLFPDLYVLGLRHPLLAVVAEPIAELRRAARTEEIVHQTESGTATFELHAFYVPEVDLVRVYIMDITQRQRTEEQLRLAASVFENTDEGILITDAETRIIDVNEAFNRISGYSRTEVIGQTPSVLSSRRHDEAFYREMWRAIGGTGQWQGEIWNRHKDGHIYPEWLTISSVHDESGALTHYVGVFTDISAIKQSQEQLDHLAHHDVLTGLPNRLLFEARLDHALERARRHGTVVALLYLDLDRFKNVNDTLGHQTGDLLLGQVAKRLSGALRAQDTVARLGGDEFTVVFEDIENVDAVIPLARKILELVSSPYRLEGHEVIVTASIGIALFPNDGAYRAELTRYADTAMYQAKELGRNAFSFYTPELTHLAAESLKLEMQLRGAIERGELAVHYQPQIDLRNGCVVGVEALARWQHPELGLVPPARFIPLAEDIGLIQAIGEWVLRRACADSRAWREAGLPPIMMAVNLSMHQLERGDLRKLYEAVRDALAANGLAGRDLELELTESAVMKQLALTIEAMGAFREMGVHLAVDDFGTGYSGLAQLRRLTFDRLKIDREFVRDITHDPDEAVIANAIITMAHALKLEVIAEGVESEGQARYLRDAGCDQMQGYLFSRPLPAAEIAALLQRGARLDVEGWSAGREKAALLLVDDDANVLAALRRTLEKEGYRLILADGGEQALESMAVERVAVVIADKSMPGMDGIDLLSRIREIHPDTVRIMLSGIADKQAMIDAINRGAIFKFIGKPWDDEQLRRVVREAYTQYVGATAKRNFDVRT